VTEADPTHNGQRVQLTPTLRGNIRLTNLGFRYTDSAPEVLHHLYLAIKPGQRVAIVGPSGSGKSTLGKLLLGLYVPTTGSVSYDGRSLKRLDCQEVRRQFGAVLQESTLFSGSILSNITLNDPDIPVERVVEAAKLAAIDEDIAAMPMGYDTILSEDRSALSEGQRQRIALARAIAHNPTILLLDEATRHLDVETEKRIAQNLEGLPCTQIIIPHRLSGVRDAGMIVVLHQGTIAECGTHDALIRRDGHYARLLRQQPECGDASVAAALRDAAPSHRSRSRRAHARSCA
jgi:ABC-type bacteriocin/lantibiotic exporter with double-glycine peptidase domain